MSAAFKIRHMRATLARLQRVDISVIIDAGVVKHLPEDVTERVRALLIESMSEEIERLVKENDKKIN